MDKQFHPTVYNGCNYLYMLGLKLNHISKNAPGGDTALRGWILKPVHQASHPWLPTSALQGASHPVSNQHNGAPRVPMSTDPVEAVTRKGHQVTMGLLSQDPKWLTTHMCWHAKQCRKCICRMHNLLFNHYATHWGWVKHLTSSIIFMI